MEFKVETNSAKETQKIGKILGSLCQGGEVFCLEGDLGGGKTTFTKGLASGLGIKEEVLSPTFILAKEYYTPSGLEFYHLDIYRIQNPQEIEELNFFEIIKKPNAIIVIEWADKIKDLLPKENCLIQFTYQGKEKRQIHFIAIGKKYEKLLEKLKQQL